MNNYSVKDFMNDVFNPFNKQAKKLSRYYKYILIVRILILVKISLILSLFLSS